MSVSYAFDWDKATEFAFEVTFISFIAQPCDDQGLKSIATNIGVFIRLVCSTKGSATMSELHV